MNELHVKPPRLRRRGGNLKLRTRQDPRVLRHEYRLNRLEGADPDTSRRAIVQGAWLLDQDDAHYKAAPV